ncbi:glucodextranase DOMON-like domain-containing protein [Stigmatella sp. ncwal1]|uniref:Glucodextranase DOMON-like domain-containing protein n=1 Tax=Stigmatella ashevillensis TaxID=2995309 RepID=A0ABT5DA20_9BACT|nr:glucodextranase DOMON-like domain-containing protein [Stigmatella ashevillena]MDC0710504.1 glucodextranase DOMON-like domain-containing protein [Stigmatella ashevillena]
MKTRLASLPLAAALVGLPAAAAGKLTFKDPSGDDNGPGKYVYPTDTVYKKGTFDLTEVTVEKKGDNVEFTATLGANLEDPWKMGSGFSLQMVFIFIDKDGKAGSGHTEGLPGLNIQFAPDSAWEKVVLLSPQAAPRLKAEVGNKASALKDDVVVPSRTKGSGRKLTASVKASELGEGDPSQWGYQVVVQSNEGFPAGNDLMTRKVNEYEGQHRFGGGHDGECDPHVIDTLAGSAKGDASEVKAQHDMLKYECAEDGSTKSPATLTMIRQGK